MSPFFALDEESRTRAVLYLPALANGGEGLVVNEEGSVEAVRGARGFADADTVVY